MAKFDLEDDWRDLGKPSRFQLALTSAPERIMKFLEFLFTWIGKAFDWLWARFTALFTGDTFFALVIGTIIIGVVGCAGYCLREVLRSDGTVHHCAIQLHQGETGYTLVGVRYWQSDITIRKDPDFNVLLKTADDIHCSIK